MTNFFFVSLLLVPHFTFSQNQTSSRSVVISGKVTVLPGEHSSVSVTAKHRIKNSGSGRYRVIGTETDQNGFYRIGPLNDGDSLIFTHISYMRVAVVVKGNNLINISMEPIVHSLPAVVISDSVVRSAKPGPLLNNEGDHEKIFERVEIEASFKGGVEALKKYFRKVIKYPDSAKKNNIQGEVLIGFTVGISGEVKNVKVVRGISPECDEKALKAVQGMPNWVPAIQNGKPIEVYIELPVSFSLVEKK